MTAIRATFDGSRVILPPGGAAHPPGQVIVIFDDEGDATGDDGALYATAQEPAFAKVWDNPEDSIYDQL